MKNKAHVFSDIAGRSKVLACLLIFVFLSALLLTTLHLVAAHAPHKVEHCSFCKLFSDQAAASLLIGLICVSVLAAAPYSAVTLCFERFSVITAKNPRGPPSLNHTS